MKYRSSLCAFALIASLGVATSVSAQIGRRFPSEKKIVPDPVTGIPLTFLTSTPAGDSKIYQTHKQWTSDGKWLIFRSQRVSGQVMAVNEENGAIVQVTEGGYTGMLCVSRLTMKLYVMRDPSGGGGRGRGGQAPGVVATNAGATETPAPTPAAGGRGLGRALQIVEVDLAKVFADSEAGAMKAASTYERVCGIVPAEMRAGGDMALDATDEFAYFRFASADLGEKLPPGTKIESRFGPRNMGAGPAGLASMNLKTGEIKFIAAVPFQIGHVQTNPWVPGEIVFCWETGGKAPQRTWTVMADGTGLRPLYPEADYEWVTHEAVVTKDEVAIAILGHRTPAKATKDSDWGISGTREHPTGLAIVNLRDRTVRIAGQTKSGSGLWHVNGSGDGRWAVGDDFTRSIYLIDRKTDEMMLLSTGHKASAADHPHPTFNADGTKIEIESAMLSADGRSMNICIIPVPKEWLARTYTQKVAAN